MKQRGRHSSAALAVVPISDTLDRVPRQSPPDELTDDEAEVWIRVVNTEPAEHFSPATVPLLVQYCRHAVEAGVIAARKRDALSDDSLTLADYDRLLHMQERESRALASLATKMRLSQQATINKRGNKKSAFPGRKLHEA